MSKSNSLGIIFRTPEYGKVKKRLASEIGHELTLTVYREMLHTTIERVCLLKNVDIYGFYDGVFPDEIALNYKDMVLLPQKGKDLGDRLYNAASYLHNKCYSKIVLIGADSPDLPIEYISEAFSRLDSFDIVIGPSEDGGYYLIATKEPLKAIFSDIPWESGDVLEKTLSVIERKGTFYFLLPEWCDIDNLETLNRWLHISHS